MSAFVSRLFKKYAIVIFMLFPVFIGLKISTLPVNAAEGNLFVFDNIYYKVLSETGNTGTVQVGSGNIYSPTFVPGTMPEAVIIPSSVQYSGKSYTVTSIGPGAFSRYVGLESVKIPNTVTEIGASAFECAFITSFEIPNSVTTIREWAFAETPLTHIVIPNSVTTIENYTFWKCPNLFRIYFLGDEPAYVAEDAFNNTVPGATAIIKSDAQGFPTNAQGTWRDLFIYRDPYLQGDIFIEDGIVYKVLSETENTGTVQAGTASEHLRSITDTAEQPVVIPPYVSYHGKTYTVTRISNLAFSRYYDLESVKIPNTVTEIGAYAFEHTALSSFEIPNGVTAIGEGAFAESLLASIIIPNSVTTIGNNVFWECLNLHAIYFLGDEPAYVAEDAFNNTVPGMPTFIKSDAKGFPTNAQGAWRDLFIVRDPYLQGEIFVVDGIVYKVLSETGNTGTVEVGTGSEHLQSITDGVEYPIVIPPSVSYRGKTFTITRISALAFSRYYDLESIKIPNTVTEIGAYAFEHTALSSFEIPNGVTTIGEGAFAETELTSIIIPNSVTTIGNNVFWQCFYLTSVTIGNRVTSIGASAFESCDLSSVYFEGDAPSVSIDENGASFHDIPPGAVAYIYPDAKGFPAEGQLWNGLIIALRTNISVLYGDVFSDGVIDSRDVVKLAQYLAGWPSAVLSDKELKAADTFADGVIDSKDIVKLAQYLAGWPVTLG